MTRPVGENKLRENKLRENSTSNRVPGEKDSFWGVSNKSRDWIRAVAYFFYLYAIKYMIESSTVRVLPYMFKKSTKIQSECYRLEIDIKMRNCFRSGRGKK